MATKTVRVMTAIGGDVPTNGAAETIAMTVPYIAHLKIVGAADLLFHRWNCEAVEAKGAAAKGSKAKKTDDVESYVYRNDDGMICLPGEYLRMSIVTAAKYRQDPRSPRKSAMDLYKAGVISLTPLAPLGGMWDYEHRCRAVVNRSGITRTRPAFKAGWEAEVDLLVNLPEYIGPESLHDVASMAGKLVGVSDNRPSYGRFQVVRFEIGNP